MLDKSLVIWVEGPDDQIIFKRFKPVFEEKGYEVEIIIYGGDQYKGDDGKDSISKYIDSMNSICETGYVYRYIFVRDFDFGSCYTSKKEEIQEDITNIDNNSIIIVKNLIESWFMAGLPRKICRKYNIPYLLNTDDLTKNDLKDCVPCRLQNSKREFLIKIANHFDISTAIERNSSFEYFINRFINKY